MAENQKLQDPLAFLRGAHPAVKRQLATSELLSDFTAAALKAKDGLSLADRQLIVEQALVLLEMTYAHLPLKRAIHAIDPVQRLKLLKFRLSEMKESDLPSELHFHEEVQDIFTSLRDFHTNYRLPAPFDNEVAFLPFLIEGYFEGGKEPKFLVTNVTEGFEHPTFKPGIEVLYWNGVPIKRAIEINGESQAGSNLDARFAAGLTTLTERAMIGSLPPNENWVVISYRSLDGRVLEYKQDWLIFTPKLAGAVSAGSGKKRATKLGIDIQRSAINQVRKILFAPQAVAGEKRITRNANKRIRLANSLETSMPAILRAYPVTTPHGTFAYIRIFNFEAEDGDEFVNEFIRLLELLPQNGLILDVRSNGGGYIDRGERLLQLFTPYSIEPELFEFINSPLNLEICRVRPDPEELSDWEQSIAQSVTTGATYSRGFTLTSSETCNAIGQRYYGPVVLIIDALCYSTTDMFAAGFKDHDIGEILGVDGNTGAGGANVWQHEDLRRILHGKAESPFKKLPKNAEMRIALRRSIRVRNQAGTPLEELGVTPDERHWMTKVDLLSTNTDLINHAAEMLSRKTMRKLSVDIGVSTDGTQAIIAKTEKISRLDLYVNGRPQQSLNVVNDLAHFVKVSLPKSSQLRLEGFDNQNNFVAVYQRTI